MDWLKWVIPLIAVGVWIISNLARSQQEQRRTTRPGPGTRPGFDNPPPTPSGPKPRRSSAEIDDFLQEVRRRRDPVAQAKPRIKSVQPVEVPRPRPSLEMSVPPLAPSAGKPAEPMPLPRLRRPEPGEEEVVVAKVVGSRPAVALPTPLPPPVMRGVQIGGTGIGRQLLQLLRNPKSMATAMVLREILDQPVSRRRKH